MITNLVRFVMFFVCAGLAALVLDHLLNLRLQRQAHRLLAETADVCPNCGQSRIYYRDGVRMTAPPHRGRCQPVSDYNGEEPYDYRKQGW